MVAAKARYAQAASAFAPISAENLAPQMQLFVQKCEGLYGEMPFARQTWGTSLLGTLVGLVCAQTCRNSWSSVCYNNLTATFASPDRPGEPDSDPSPSPSP